MNKLQDMHISPVLHYLDIETLDTRLTAQVASIGLVSVEVVSGRRVGEFYCCVDIQSQPERTRSADTLAWWNDRNKTSLDAYEATFAGSAIPLGEALASLVSAILAVERTRGAGGYPQVMGSGPEFDNAIIEHAAQQCGLRLPWRFRGNQSVRTLTWLGKAAGISVTHPGDVVGIKHHALHDARWEAHCGQYVLHSLLPHLFGAPGIYDTQTTE